MRYWDGDYFDGLKITENRQLCVGGTEACQEEIQQVIIITGGSDALVNNTKPTESRLHC